MPSLASASSPTSKSCSPRAAATAHNRYRGLRSLFGWILDEGEIERNTMERMKPPILPEKPVGVVPLADIKKILDTCDPKMFAGRRDEALLRVFLDTGGRRRSP